MSMAERLPPLTSNSVTALSAGLGGQPSELTVETPQDFHWLRANIPCQVACPAGTDIPGYLEAVYRGDYAGAYDINLRDNVFPAVLGRVCSRPCELACRHGWAGNGESVAICFSKRSASDLQDRPPIVLRPFFPPSGKRVAVVGAGVAGLSAARELALSGHKVIVYERHQRAGGMLNQGIPAFRLPREVIEREIEQIFGSGVEIRCGISVGRDIELEQLTDDYDAVVMAAGTLRPNWLALSGHNLGRIEHGLSFLLAVNEFGRREIGSSVIVVGGGYTAMDCARTALRLGANVTIYYRRGAEDMVVLPGELEQLREEGGVVHTGCTPITFLGQNRRIEKVRFIRTRGGAPGQDGRRLPVDIAGSEFEVEADSVIIATGQFPETSWIGRPFDGDLVGSDQWLASGKANATKHPKIFAAGDFALGATTLINAIGHAKFCAAEVDVFLTGMQRVKEVVRIEPAFCSKAKNGRTTGRTSAMNATALHPMPTSAVSQRGLEQEVELGYRADVAQEAASRCYLCHYKFEIDDGRCVLCDECLRVKPVPDCIVEISALARGDDGAIIGYSSVKKGDTPSLYYSRLWIDQSQCVRCGACEAACPVNAISIQKVSLVKTEAR
jgi:NADPH-dependent glutamate synthase beta subunit-like oxidoreductase/NAD-dependent dihydropyrimidine dehydrogenase PreA subunit